MGLYNLKMIIIIIFRGLLRAFEGVRGACGLLWLQCGFNKCGLWVDKKHLWINHLTSYKQMLKYTYSKYFKGGYKMFEELIMEGYSEEDALDMLEKVHYSYANVAVSIDDYDDDERGDYVIIE